jgi:hypothetical protein
LFKPAWSWRIPACVRFASSWLELSCFAAARNWLICALFELQQDRGLIQDLLRLARRQQGDRRVEVPVLVRGDCDAPDLLAQRRELHAISRGLLVDQAEALVGGVKLLLHLVVLLDERPQLRLKLGELGLSLAERRGRRSARARRDAHE